MDEKFRRYRDERILLEGSGAYLLTDKPSLAAMLTADHIKRCKFYVTNSRVVGAAARGWMQSRSALVWLLLPIIWSVTALIPRTMYFDIPIEALRTCIYWKKKGRFIFVDFGRHTHVVVSHGFHRDAQARKMFATLSSLNPSVRSQFVETKDLPPDLAEVFA
jgi:hypothetical protein